MKNRRTVFLSEEDQEFLGAQLNASATVREALRVYKELLAYADVLSRMDGQDRKLDEILAILRSGQILTTNQPTGDGDEPEAAARGLAKMTEKFKRGER